MKITKRLTDLEVGTVIERPTGIIILASHIKPHLNAYACVDAKIKPDGSVVAKDNEISYVTTNDLIGGVIIGNI